MPVVINEFEVVNDSETTRGQAAAPSPAQPQAPAADVERLLADQRARARRVRAY